MNLLKYIKINNNYIIFFFFTSFIFLSSIKFEYFQFRYLILLLLFPCVAFFFKDLKNRDFKIIKYLLFFLLFFSIHLLINFRIDNEKISLYNIFSLFYLLAILTIAYYFVNIFNKNIFKVINIFIFIFFFSTFMSFLNFQLDNPYFCGGIPDIFNFLSTDLESLLRPHYHTKISFREYIFSENSHLGMIAPSIIAFMIYYMNEKNFNFIKKIPFFIFFIICFIKSSTTLLFCTSLSLLIILFFNNKKLSKKIKFIFISITLIFTSILLLSDECKSRFVTINNDAVTEKKIILNIDKSVTSNIKTVNFQKSKNIIGHRASLKENVQESLTKAVQHHAFSILKKSIQEKPFGWGLNRYDKAFEYYNYKHEPKNKNLKVLNSKDGTNNFIKIFVEFGIFGIFVYLLIFLFLIEKNISIELKLFYLPLLITQSIRGAGYFNGGFILIAFFMLFTYINFNKKLK